MLTMSPSRLTAVGLHGAFALVIVAAHIACGGGGGGNGNAAAPTSNTTAADSKESSPNPSSRGGEVATGNTLTEFQKRRLLGHYSTSDGASGFILDRTVTPWKAKLDGVAKTVTLKETNEPRQGVKEYTSDDKSIWVRVDDRGSVQLFQGPKQTSGVEVHRDADAEQLK